MFMNTQQKGKCLTFPDVCKTPPQMLTMPYLNQGRCQDGAPRLLSRAGEALPGA
ncbi:hypothetical protein GCM10027514_13140 [Azotobacter armeniacus]